MDTRPNAPVLESRIPDSLAGKRLDQALATVFPDFSRSRLTRWLRDGRVTMDAKVVKPRQIVAGGELVSVTPAPSSGEPWSAQALPLSFVYEDEDLLVVEKPAGLVVHPGAGNHEGTLVNALLHHCPELGALPRAGVVHRLDKETSGLLVVARTHRAHRALVAALSERAVAREYAAVVNGVPVSGGRVDAPIGRHPVHRTRMAVTSRGKSAGTTYRIEARYRAHALLGVNLETGRTHQIRVHMAHAGYPLVGDPTYGRKRIAAGVGAALRERLQAFPRQALHARRLTLRHPRGGRELTLESPLPEDLRALTDALARDAAGA